jgi:CheY-like chemotaxis protein
MAGTILIVDDNAMFGALIVHFLTRDTPYNVRWVKTGKKAFEANREMTFILFILDYHLPDTTGLELADHLHQLAGRKTIPTILLSAAYPSAELEAQLAIRHIAGMGKPFDADLLIQLINRTLAITPPEGNP